MFAKFIVRTLAAIFAFVGVYLSALMILPFVLWINWKFNQQMLEDKPVPQIYLQEPKSGQCYSQYDAQGKYHSDPQITKCR